MDAKRYIERILDDEGLTSGLADPEAGRLVAWLGQRVEEAVRSARTPADADQAVGGLAHAARRIARVVEAACHDQNLDKARALWNDAGLGPLPPLPLDQPVRAVEMLIQRQEATHA